MTSPSLTPPPGDVPCRECDRYRSMLTVVRSVNADWDRRYRELHRDFRRLLYNALTINDRLRLHVDHAEFTGSMNNVEDFRELTNALHAEYAPSFTDDDVADDLDEETF